MTYATRQDLENRYGADLLNQRESMLPPGAVDTALADAQAMINGYLASRYVLPLTVVDQVIPAMACAIARYVLLGDADTERSRNDYKDAIAWLKDVAAGRVQLQAAAPVPGNSPESLVMMFSSESVFKRAGRP